jgi:hypothetical protein
MHLMLQPNVAALFLGDGMLAEQGLLSRVLATARESAIGSRMWREASEDSDNAIKSYGGRLLNILERPLPLSDGKKNELAPRELGLSIEAREKWVKFHDHIERDLKEDGPLWPVKGLGNKIPEITVRLSGTLTLIGDINAQEISAGDLERGITLAEHYVAEALRLFEASRVNADLLLAQRVLDWSQRQWTEECISLPDIYQRGPNAIRDKETAAKLVKILTDHGWLIPQVGGAEVDGRFRREAWKVVRE